MTLVLLFSIVNIVIAWYYERKRSKVVTVVQAIAFFILLTFLLVASDYKYIVTAMQNLLGTEFYSTFREIIFDQSHIISIFAELEIIVVVLCVLVPLAIIEKAVERLFEKKKDERSFGGAKQDKEEPTVRPMLTVAILQLHCRQNC